VWALSQLMGRKQLSALAASGIRTEQDETVRAEWQLAAG
jgi:hypothetical protein